MERETHTNRISHLEDSTHTFAFVFDNHESITREKTATLPVTSDSVVAFTPLAEMCPWSQTFVAFIVVVFPRVVSAEWSPAENACHTPLAQSSGVI